MEENKFLFKNMGTLDRVLRLVVAGIIAVFYFADIISGILVLILAVIAIAFTLTSMVGSCPLYLPFGLSTLRKKIKP